MKKIKFRQLSKCLTVFMLTSLLANVIPNNINTRIAKADEGTIKMAKPTAGELPSQITVDGKVLKRKGQPTLRSDVKLPLINFNTFRQMKVTYYLKWDNKQNMFHGSRTRVWDKRGNPQKAYGISEDMSLWSGGVDNGKVVYEPKSCESGSDFLNIPKEAPDDNGTIYKFIPHDFDNDVWFTATNDAFLKGIFKDYHPQSIFFTGELKRKAIHDRRGLNANGNAGIDYGILTNFLKKGNILVNTRIGKPGKGDPRWLAGTDFFLSGEYGNETFNYYTPEYKLKPFYEAVYEGELPPTPIPPTPKPDPPTPSGSLPCGRIIHTPDHTKWTNRGKTSNGHGHYDIDIKPTMPHVVGTGYSYSYDRCERCGKHSCHSYRCCRCKETFDVTYDLDYIQCSSATNDRVGGTGGTVSIRQEGEGQKVDSIGYWQRPDYTVEWAHSYSHDGYTIPDEPCHPKGHSETYDIDWTDPVIKVAQKAPNKWKNNPYYQPIDVTITDNLSGFNSSKSYIKITDISHYRNNYFIHLNEASLNDVNHWDLSDGIYQIDIEVYDRAGNHSEYHDKWFKVDGIPPDITISDQGYHRHIDSLTFDTYVSDNIEELDELTVSGWSTYGNEKAKVANQTEVMRPITYPHIKHEDTNYTFYYKVEDLATNQTTKSFVTSVVREYWKWAHTTYGSDFDTEVPVKFLNNKDKVSLAGFTKSRTIDFDTWRGIPVEVWYKFTSHYNVNFIRVIHYDDPKIPIITADGKKLYPCTGTDEFKDAPPLSNEIGLEVGTDEYVESFGKCTDPKPIKVVDNGDGTHTCYYVNGDVRRYNKDGSVVKTKEKGYGQIIPESIEYLGNKTIYHTSMRYRIEIIETDSQSTMKVYDWNNNCVSNTTMKK